MKTTFEKLEFDKILKLAENKCVSELGKEKFRSIAFFTDLAHIKNELQKTAEFKYILENYDFPLGNIFDLRQKLEKAKIKGIYLEAEEFYKLWQTVDTVKSMVAFLKHEDNSKNYPALRQLTKNIKIYPFITQRISKIIDTNGQVRSSASKKLKEIRNSITEKQQQAKKIVENVFSYAKRQGYLDAEAQIVVRGGKLLIPVPAFNKHKIKGIVQDRSETGKTYFIEPYKAVELHNEISDLIFEEKKEITKILTNLTDELRDYFPDILSYYEFLAETDFVMAKAKLAQDLNAEEVQVEDKPYFNIINAKHPLLFLHYKKAGKKVVPLNIRLSEEQKIIIISGPNAGGKSVALKTVGLLQLMIQTGFLVPASPKSVFGVFDQIFIDIGDDQSIDNDISTYSSHLLNIKTILQTATERSLILLDEFGTGTDPTFGSAIAEAILEEFLAKNFKAIITTHYSNLKYFAAENQQVVNAAMLFDNQNLKPLYILETGHPGSSYTFEIAQNIGLPQDIINKAKNIAGSKKINFENLIADLEKERRQVARLKTELAKTKKELKQKVLDYRNEYEKILTAKKSIIRQANEEAEKILAQANKLIEKTIFEIKSHKAEKEKTKRTRQEFERQKKHLQEKLSKEINKIEKEIEKIPKRKKEKAQPREVISIGDYVKVKNQNIKGYVEAIKDDVAMITFGAIRTYFPLKELEKITPEKENKAKVKVNISEKPQQSLFLRIDVRGERADDALRKVAKFIDTALISDARELTILHGTGDGILRKVIRDYLAKLDFVEWFGDADIRQGGQGVTVVKLK